MYKFTQQMSRPLTPQRQFSQQQPRHHQIQQSQRRPRSQRGQRSNQPNFNNRGHQEFPETFAPQCREPMVIYQQPLIPSFSPGPNQIMSAPYSSGPQSPLQIQIPQHVSYSPANLQFDSHRNFASTPDVLTSHHGIKTWTTVAAGLNSNNILTDQNSNFILKRRVL
jgi:hypothetical protein